MPREATFSSQIPVLLLKTKSAPIDSYEEYFSATDSPFLPIFIPVLEHRPNARNLDFVRSLLTQGGLGNGGDAKYGGMIFTSQRAVEGFAKVVDEVEGAESDGAMNTEQSASTVRSLPFFDSASSCLRSADSSSDLGFEALPKSDPLHNPPIFPIYVVGPATARGLSSVLSASALHPRSVLRALNPQISGGATGNGEALAQYIKQHYNGLVRHDGHQRLPLLFLVGEQRRDIIPKTLSDPTLPESQRIQVDELVVYETGVMESFATDFGTIASQIETDKQCSIAIVVVFSPSGCEAMLRRLGFIDRDNRLTENGKRRLESWEGEPGKAEGRTRYIIATIGPTTRDYLRREFAVEAEVCAEKPSPEGVGECMRKFLSGFL